MASTSGLSASNVFFGNAKILQVLDPHNNEVTCCDFAANFDILATGSSDKVVYIWQWCVGSGFIEVSYSPLLGHKYGVSSVRFSPQGSLLATASIDGCIILWNSQSGNKVVSFVQDNGDAVRTLRFAQNEKLLVTAGDNGGFFLWDLGARVLVRSITRHDGITLAVAVTCDSLFLLSSCTSGLMHLWYLKHIEDTTLDDCEPLLTIDDAHDLGILSCDFANVALNGNLDKESGYTTYLLATAGNDQTIKLWHLKSKIQPKDIDNTQTDVILEMVDVLEGHGSAVTYLCFNGIYLASTSLDKTCRVWNCQTFECVATLDGHTRYVNCCSFSKTMKFLATGSNDKTIIIWDLSGETTFESELVKPSTLLSYLTTYRDLVQNDDKHVTLLQKLANIHNGSVNTCSINKDNTLVTGSGDKTIKIFRLDLEAEQFVETSSSPLTGHSYTINQLEFSENGELLVSCSLDGQVILWDMKDIDAIEKINLARNPLGIRACRISLDGNFIIAGGDDENAKVYAATTKEEVMTLTGHADAIYAVAFSPDAKLLVTACSGGDFRLWELHNTENEDGVHLEKEAHDLGVQFCDFSNSDVPIPNVNVSPTLKCYLLATCGNDSLIKLWKILVFLNEDDFLTSNVVVTLWRTLVGHGGNVNCVKFSPQSGEILCSVGTDRQARIWSPYNSACLYVIDHDSMLTSCAFTYDCSILVVTGLDKSVWIWKLPQQLTFQTVIAKRIKSQRQSVGNWTSDDVSKWVKSINLEQMMEIIQSNEVDGDKLLNLDDDDLTSLLQLDDEDDKDTFFNQLSWLKHDNTGQGSNRLNDVPHEYLCPITQEIMHEPVICSDGYTYEKAAITEWLLSGRLTSPMTNDLLLNMELDDNEELRAKIDKYLKG